LEKSLENIKKQYPDRFILFSNIDFGDIDDPQWSARTTAQLERDVKQGAKGLKIYKSLGFTVRDVNGKRVRVDDPRLDPIWKKAGELKIPVIIHTADPKSFWDPLDSMNERWLELVIHPERKRSDTDPAQHIATYQFADQASLDRAVNGADLKRLVADFNRDWPDVTRTRELLVLAEEFGA